ncbi:DNA polymerase [Vibrio crassostreae]|uniref:DNA polymerase n=1 Tax=Vibrio crassostreae TaxID=246167 RepID=UPI002E18C923|nr:DNA polymerase [Vibrio crassostreae]
MKTLETAPKTTYQLMRETEHELEDFLQSTFFDTKSLLLDDQVSKFEAELRGREEAKKEIDKRINRYLEGIKSAPWAAMRGKGKAIHISIDSEWVFNHETGKNDILCYSYSLRIGDKSFSGVKHTDMAKLIKQCRDQGLSKEDEMDKRKQLTKKGYKSSFDKFIQELLIKAKARGFIDEWPEHTFIYAHFLRADIASFEEFWNIGTNNKNHKNSLTTVQGTVTSGRGAYGIDLDSIGRSKYKIENTKFYSSSNNAFETKVRFVDTMLLSSKASLDEIGELVGFPKMTLPDNMIERMDDLYCKDTSLFNRYAIRDADIALEYGLRMQKFALVDLRKDIGLELNSLPSTLGNLGVSLFRDSCGGAAEMHQFLGYEKRKNQYYHAKSNSIRNSVELAKTVSREYTDALAVSAFYGGANFGAYFGPTEVGDYNDFDLSGAYTTALVDILEPDYLNSFESKDIEDYLGHKMGFAYVRFKHDDKENFGLLPCRTSLRGIYYPLEGETYVTAPELQLAHDAGVEIEILHGQVIPWKNGSTSKFKEFTKTIRKQRAKYKEKGNELYEKLWKLIGNTLYGKVGQGLRDKSGFDLASGLSSKIPYSPVTNAHAAAHATGFVRGTMLEVMRKLCERYGDDIKIISATTDGWLCNATEEQLEQCLDGPLARRFQQICTEVSGEDMMQLKHHAKQIISMKTRGQLTAELGDTKPVCAKAGIKAPKGVDENEWMVELFLDRYPGQKVARKHLASARDQWLKEMDLVSIHTEQTLNLEYDFKRRPVNPRMVEVRHPKSGGMVEHLSFDTVPWNTVDEGLDARTYFDEWRVNNCLKTMEDWDNWMDFYKVRSYLKGTGVKYLEDGSEGIFKVQMLRAITQGKWGLSEAPKRAPRGHYDKMVAMFEADGIEGITKQDLANSKGRKLLESKLPVTPRMLPLLSWLVRKYLMVDMTLIFHPDEVDEAVLMLEDYNREHTEKLVA